MKLVNHFLALVMLLAPASFAMQPAQQILEIGSIENRTPHALILEEQFLPKDRSKGQLLKPIKDIPANTLTQVNHKLSHPLGKDENYYFFTRVKSNPVNSNPATHKGAHEVNPISLWVWQEGNILHYKLINHAIMETTERVYDLSKVNKATMNITILEPSMGKSSITMQPAQEAAKPLLKPTATPKPAAKPAAPKKV